MLPYQLLTLEDQAQIHLTMLQVSQYRPSLIKWHHQLDYLHLPHLDLNSHGQLYLHQATEVHLFFHTSLNGIPVLMEQHGLKLLDTLHSPLSLHTQ